LLCADDLALIAENKEDLIRKLNQWKDGVEGKGMKVNMNRSKVMISGESCKGVHSTGRWPCSFVVGVLVETQYNVLTVRYGCTGSVVV